MTAFEPRDPDWDRKVRDSFARQTVMTTIGARVAALKPGYCEIELPFRRDLCQQHGFLHAGITTTIADSAAGYAAFSLMPSGSSVLTVEFKVNLMAPAAGDVFLGRGKVIKPGRTLLAVEAEVIARDKDGEKAVAQMLATMMCLADKADAPAGG
ncbi:MAG TPA: PaaI family thioesterase [Xanthobacteraceae bacterium]|nr:PaaI family thioesterase [Xanthobacteraceae bacterium]